MFGDGYTTNDRVRDNKTFEKIVRLEEQFKSAQEANDLWHTNSEDKCTTISLGVAAAHRRVDSVKVCLARKSGWFTGVRATVGISISIAIAVGTAIWTVISRY